MWKADDPMLNFCSVNFYLAATVYTVYMFDENCSRDIFIYQYTQYFITSQGSGIKMSILVKNKLITMYI